MKNLALLFALILLIASPHLFAQNCVSDTSNVFSFTFGGHNYEIIKEKKNWTDAAACAVERGGYLVELNDLTEHNIVYAQITSGAAIPNNYTTVSDGGNIAYVWIGATDKVAEGEWLWDGDNDNSGTNFWNGQGTAGSGGGSAVGGAFVNWGGASNQGNYNEPDDFSGQDGAAIGLSGWPGGIGTLGKAGEWNDIDLSNQLYYIIEFDASNSIDDQLFPQPGLYPNPAKETVAIDFASTQIDIEVEVYNLAGQLIMTHSAGTTQSFSLNTSSLEPGYYLLQIDSKDQHHKMKLVIE